MKKLQINNKDFQKFGEPLLYGKRLKATIQKHKEFATYLVTCYGHGGKIIEQKLFDGKNIDKYDYQGRLNVYHKAHDYAHNYLYTCKY